MRLTRDEFVTHLAEYRFFSNVEAAVRFAQITECDDSGCDYQRCRGWKYEIPLDNTVGFGDWLIEQARARRERRNGLDAINRNGQTMT